MKTRKVNRRVQRITLVTFILVGLLVAVLLATGCSAGLSAAGEPTAAVDDARSEPLPTAPGRLTFAPATVESVTVQIDESAPAPVSLVVHGNLPDNCTEIRESGVAMSDERTFIVSVATSRPAGEACGEVLVPYETVVSLGVDVKELPAGEYTVIVNDQLTETFTWNPDDVAHQPAGRLPQVSLALAEAVAADFAVHALPAATQTGQTPAWAMYPEHIEVVLNGYAHAESLQRPRIYVYPVDPFSEMSDIASEQIAQLEELLVKKPDLNELPTLPFLPFLNAQAMIDAQAHYLTFADGSGIRYLTQFGQAAGPINNRELFYTFQGLTSDGDYYVSAIFPVAQAALPADMASADNSFADGYEAYIEAVKADLEMAAPGSFTPDLALLDSIAGSIEIE